MSSCGGVERKAHDVDERALKISPSQLTTDARVCCVNACTIPPCLFTLFSNEIKFSETVFFYIELVERCTHRGDMPLLLSGAMRRDGGYILDEAALTNKFITSLIK